MIIKNKIVLGITGNYNQNKHIKYDEREYDINFTYQVDSFDATMRDNTFLPYRSYN